jgi:hypothetical protein
MTTVRGAKIESTGYVCWTVDSETETDFVILDHGIDRHECWEICRQYPEPIWDHAVNRVVGRFARWGTARQFSRSVANMAASSSGVAVTVRFDT